MTEKIFQQTNQPLTFGLLCEFVGHQARCSHSQDEEDDLTVVLVNARRIEGRELGLGPKGIKRFAGDLSVQVDCGVGIAEGLDCVVLAAKLFVYLIESFSPPPGPVKAVAKRTMEQGHMALDQIETQWDVESTAISIGNCLVCCNTFILISSTNSDSCCVYWAFSLSCAVFQRSL